MHTYYREKKIEYRYFEKNKTRRMFLTTKNGAHKYWELTNCLKHPKCPIDQATKTNLIFLIGLRHEIEHQMTTKIDNFLSARLQACCLNYNTYLKKLFKNQNGIAKHLSFSLQFSSISQEQIDQLGNYKGLPHNISSYIQNFDRDLNHDLFNDIKFSYRVLFTRKTVNRKGQADQVIEFISEDSNIAKGMNKKYIVVKEKERKKYLPSEIWIAMQKIGFTNFKSHQHTMLWKDQNAKKPSNGFGTQVAKTWYWYDSWLDFVKDHCKKNRSRYI